MKKAILFTLITFISIGTLTAQEKLNINSSNSKIQWIGEYTFYFGGHEGTIDFQEGFLLKTGNKITGGSFIINMASIKNTDIKNPDSNQSLVNHLKDPDFFDVKNFPLAKLEITRVTYEGTAQMKIEANLTIKGITLPINFQAEANFEKSLLSTKFKIDRRRWGINYTSKLRDSAISDAIGFIVTIGI